MLSSARSTDEDAAPATGSDSFFAAPLSATKAVDTLRAERDEVGDELIRADFVDHREDMKG